MILKVTNYIISIHFLPLATFLEVVSFQGAPPRSSSPQATTPAGVSAAKA